MGHIHNAIRYTDSFLDKIKRPVLWWSMLILHIAYLLIFIGILSTNSVYLDYLSTFIQVFIGLFLAYRFNPLRTAELKEYDETIIFGSAVFLLTNVGLTQLGKYVSLESWYTL